MEIHRLRGIVSRASDLLWALDRYQDDTRLDPELRVAVQSLRDALQNEPVVMRTRRGGLTSDRQTFPEGAGNGRCGQTSSSSATFPLQQVNSKFS